MDGDDADVVALGVELLAKQEGEVSLSDAVDRLEALTTNPTTTREILDTAALRGIVDRENGIVRPQGGAFVRYESDVVTREGEFTCRRCGAGISTGHFVRLDAGELGPFGSSCVRKVTGRD